MFFWDTVYMLVFGRPLVSTYPPDFRNLSGHRCTMPHHHVKVADYGGDCTSFELY